MDQMVRAGAPQVDSPRAKGIRRQPWRLPQGFVADDPSLHEHLLATFLRSLGTLLRREGVP